MMLPDVNVLIYAFRRDTPHHRESRAWLVEASRSDAPFAISPLVLSAVARITTGRTFFPMPSSIEEAFEFCEYLLGLPQCCIVRPGERHWDIFRRLCKETGTSGPRVTDAWFAALALEHGCEWITFDRDYARFPGLNWRAPEPP